MSRYLERLKINPSELLIPSVLWLILANLGPLFGVFFLHWQVFPILLLFWIENVMVGLFNALKMLLATPKVISIWLAKLFIIPFFCVHYGLFTLVHGVFVFGFFGGYFGELDGFPNADSVFQVIADFQLGWAVLALFLSHLVSFVINYVGKGEYKQSKLMELMFQPYSRVVILHVTIIIGAFLAVLAKAPASVLVILILLKIFIDVKTHLREHKKYAAREELKAAGAEAQLSDAQ
jgi:hypothetical protein